MSLSIGPLTAPLARTCASDSMTRMRYVSRVPGPCRTERARRMLLNDDSPTRLLKRCASTRPAPPLICKPSAENTGCQSGSDPEGKRAGADRRSWHDERVRITRRARQRDSHLEVARAGARAMRAGRQMLGERGTLDERQLAIELGVDLLEPLFVGISH